jgi:hypothetical protein
MGNDLMMQWGFTANHQGNRPSLPSAFGAGYSRALGRGLNTWWDYDNNRYLYWTLRALACGLWAFVEMRTYERSDVFVVRIPPTPAKDSIDRSTWVPVPVQLAPPASVDNVVLEFGYDPAFRCTTRDEACASVATSTAWSASNPYWFASESFAGAPRADSMTLFIPAISNRVVYYRWRYRDSGGAVLATSRTHIAVTE